MGTMQRWPLSQASRKAWAVETVSERAFTSLSARSRPSEADFTQCGTRPHWAATSSRAGGAAGAGGVSEAEGSCCPVAASAATATLRMKKPDLRGVMLRSLAAGASTPKASR